MQKNLLYMGAFVVLVLLQIFILDNISLSVFFHPMIYIAFIIMLPLDLKPLWVLLLSALMGLAIDMLTGMHGLNVIATTATGFMRPLMLRLAVGHATGADDSLPSLHRLSTKHLAWFIILVTSLHSFIFFMLESLSLSHLPYTLRRLVISASTASLMSGYVVKLFTKKILNK